MFVSVYTSISISISMSPPTHLITYLHSFNDAMHLALREFCIHTPTFSSH